jgi:hypothetical protein
MDSGSGPWPNPDRARWRTPSHKPSLSGPVTADPPKAGSIYQPVGIRTLCAAFGHLLGRAVQRGRARMRQSVVMGSTIDEPSAMPDFDQRVLSLCDELWTAEARKHGALRYLAAFSGFGDRTGLRDA